MDAAEAEPRRAFAVNALAPRFLARAARDAGALLVHVLDRLRVRRDGRAALPRGRRPAPARRSTAPRSSRASTSWPPPGGEHLVVRTSGVLGRGRQRAEGRLVRRADRGAGAGGQAAARGRGPGVRARPSPPTSRRRSIALVARRRARALPRRRTPGSCSWHELAVAALRRWPASTRPVERDPGRRARSCRRAAPRTPCSTASRYLALGLPPLRPWRDALPDCPRPRGAHLTRPGVSTNLCVCPPGRLAQR